jgi:hypothetical protein
MRDINKLLANQDEGVIGTKYIGYFAFWLRKLKPIAFAYLSSDTTRSREIININEIVAIEMAVSMLSRNGKRRLGSIREVCDLPCTGEACIARFSNNLLEYQDYKFHRYLVYSMAHRTFGPHHFCSILDSIEFAACDHLRNGPAQPQGAAV